MDTLKSLKNVALQDKTIKILGVKSNKMFWAEALTEQGIIRSFGNTLDEAVNRVVYLVKKEVA